MWHTIMIALHAASASIALFAGCLAIRRGALFEIYLWSLVGMEVFLVLAIATDWAAIAPSSRLLFVLFALLGLIMVGRAGQAHRIRPSDNARPSAGYIDHVGFALVALFDVFIMILVLDLSGPGWLVAGVGYTIAVAGRFTLRTVRAHFAEPVTGPG